MKVAIIGSTCYKDNLMKEHYANLVHKGHDVRMPAFDDDSLSEYDICAINREMIDWADEVHLIYDGRSLGTVFDCGMTFALRKPLRVQYINPRQFLNFMTQYDYISREINTEVK